MLGFFSFFTIEKLQRNMYLVVHVDMGGAILNDDAMEIPMWFPSDFFLILHGKS